LTAYASLLRQRLLLPPSRPAALRVTPRRAN